jgi:hypothetical protein
VIAQVEKQQPTKRKRKMLRFNDGVNIDTSGPLRTLRLKDGYYVVGQGMCIPVANREEAKKVIAEMEAQR